MATTEEVKKLAALARITISEAELAAFTKEFDSILAYDKFFTGSLLMSFC
jgi:Asp-tRNA(Asn)/Glu-tRNA(Gln) amidotransferase C subunit